MNRHLRSRHLGSREDARACLDAAVSAVDPYGLTARYLTGRLADLDADRIHLAAVGKAAAAMTRGAQEILAERLAGGAVIVPGGGEAPVLDPFEIHGGGHPIPNEEGMTGARAIRDLAAGLGAGDLLLCLISGGGSALMTLPPEGVSLADVQATTQALLRAGAEIGDLNCVRKHLDELKGGRLARAAAPARVLALVLSDVIGDPLDVIASGPVSPDPTTCADATAVLRRFGIWDSTPRAVRDHLEAGEAGRAAESPGEDDPCFERVTARVVGNNRKAAEAALDEARRGGYEVLLLTTVLTGEAREVGRVLASIGLEIRRGAAGR